MRGQRHFSNWRTVRLYESQLHGRLRSRYSLWLHGWCIGLIVVAFMWGASHLQMVLGSESLALRYAVTLGAGYLAYLLVLRVWASALVSDQRMDPGGDIPSFGSNTGSGSGGGSGGTVESPALPRFESGGGGDFAGGGATGDFEVGEAGTAVGEAISGAAEIAGGADEGAVVVIPVILLFFLGAAFFFGAGSLLWLYFGSEALLAVAIELAFGYVSARTAVGVIREGWLGAAVRLTWKPLLGALACAVLAGALLDRFVPQARSLPHAIQLLKAAR